MTGDWGCRYCLWTDALNMNVDVETQLAWRAALAYPSATIGSKRRILGIEEVAAPEVYADSSAVKTHMGAKKSIEAA